MAKVKVHIEEILCKAIEYDLPDDMSINERMEVAEKMALESYKNSEIILTANDFTGIANIMIEDVESKTETGWGDI